MKKKIIVTLIVFFCCSFTASAQEPSAEEFYREQYKISGAESIEEYLPSKTREYLNENGINPESSEWIASLNSQNVFEHILAFLKGGIKVPLLSGASILAVILISAALSSMEAGGMSEATLYATVLSGAAIIIAPAYSVITASVEAMQGCAVFMSAFVPVFAAILVSAGAAATSASMSALLLGASQLVSYISNFAVVPLLSGYLAISVAAAASPLVAKSGIAEGIKKLSFWIMSLLTTVFVGILSIQTAVNASADTLALKTARFIVGSSVPVAGAVLSEALTTVTASLGLLKSSIGVYGIIGCCAIFLPLLVELFLWRVVLVLCTCVSELFSLAKMSSLLRCVDTVMSVIAGIILLTCAMFVISLSVVVTAGKAI